jgi:AAA+ superfamily predicted ATPase
MDISECVRRGTLAPDERLDALWESIVVDDSLKTRLLNHAVLAANLRSKVAFEYSALHGLITVYGPPGTGKTTLAQGLAGELARLTERKVRLVELDTHGLMSGEHGQSQERVSELLGDYVPSLAADGLLTLVLIDEIESMAVARSAASLAANPADLHRATDAALLAFDRNAIDHPHILWVATSNFTEALDDAFLSRSDVAIAMPVPPPKAVAAIIRSTLNSFSSHFPDLADVASQPEVDELAHACSGIDGRQARKLVVNALAQRLDTARDPNRLTTDDLRTAAAQWQANPDEEPGR